MKIYKLFVVCFFIISIYSSDKRAEEFYEDGFNFYKDGNFEAAAVEFENAVNLDKDYFFIMSSNMMFECLLNANSNKVDKEVEKICNHFLQDSKNEMDPFVLYYLGWALLKLGKSSQAKSYLNASIKKMNQDSINSDMVKKLLNSIKT